mmetsp:Transcript_25015/g.37414  ORF Transcript_25015/g.37414 Transcript_25015/m.37414 type:complete len:217 (+) Transcript_25015:126-776(+)
MTFQQLPPPLLLPPQPQSPPPPPLSVVFTLLDSIDKVNASAEIIKSETNANGLSTLSCILPPDHNTNTATATATATVANFGKHYVKRYPHYLYNILKQKQKQKQNQKHKQKRDNTSGNSGNSGMDCGDCDFERDCDCDCDCDAMVRFGDEKEKLVLKIREYGDTSSNYNFHGDSEKQEIAKDQAQNVPFELITFGFHLCDHDGGPASLLYAKGELS